MSSPTKAESTKVVHIVKKAPISVSPKKSEPRQDATAITTTTTAAAVGPSATTTSPAKGEHTINESKEVCSASTQASCIILSAGTQLQNNNNKLNLSNLHLESWPCLHHTGSSEDAHGSFSSAQGAEVYSLNLRGNRFSCVVGHRYSSPPPAGSAVRPCTLALFPHLSSLDLSHNALVSVEGLSALRGLQSLRLGHNKLTSLSPLFRPATASTSSSSSSNNNHVDPQAGLNSSKATTTDTLETALGLLATLDVLDVSHNELTELFTAADVSYLEGVLKRQVGRRGSMVNEHGVYVFPLRVLYASYNQIGSLPSFFTGSSRNSSCSNNNNNNNEMKDIDGEESAHLFSHLEDIKLHRNKLNNDFLLHPHFPSIHNFPRLKNVDLTDNHLTDEYGIAQLRAQVAAQYTQTPSVLHISSVAEQELEASHAISASLYSSSHAAPLAVGAAGDANTDLHPVEDAVNEEGEPQEEEKQKEGEEEEQAESNSKRMVKILTPRTELIYRKERQVLKAKPKEGLERGDEQEREKSGDEAEEDAAAQQQHEEGGEQKGNNSPNTQARKKKEKKSGTTKAAKRTSSKSHEKDGRGGFPPSTHSHGKAAPSALKSSNSSSGRKGTTTTTTTIPTNTTEKPRRKSLTAEDSTTLPSSAAAPGVTTSAAMVPVRAPAPPLVAAGVARPGANLYTINMSLLYAQFTSILETTLCSNGGAGKVRAMQLLVAAATPSNGRQTLLQWHMSNANNNNNNNSSNSNNNSNNSTSSSPLALLMARLPKLSLMFQEEALFRSLPTLIFFNVPLPACADRSDVTRLFFFYILKSIVLTRETTLSRSTQRSRTATTTNSNNNTNDKGKGAQDEKEANMSNINAANQSPSALPDKDAATSTDSNTAQDNNTVLVPTFTASLRCYHLWRHEDLRAVWPYLRYKSEWEYQATRRKIRCTNIYGTERPLEKEKEKEKEGARRGCSSGADANADTPLAHPHPHRYSEIHNFQYEPIPLSWQFIGSKFAGRNNASTRHKKRTYAVTNSVFANSSNNLHVSLAKKLFAASYRYTTAPPAPPPAREKSGSRRGSQPRVSTGNPNSSLNNTITNNHSNNSINNTSGNNWSARLGNAEVSTTNNTNHTNSASDNNVLNLAVPALYAQPASSYSNATTTTATTNTEAEGEAVVVDLPQREEEEERVPPTESEVPCFPPTAGITWPRALLFALLKDATPTPLATYGNNNNNNNSTNMNGVGGGSSASLLNNGSNFQTSGSAAKYSRANSARKSSVSSLAYNNNNNNNNNYNTENGIPSCKESILAHAAALLQKEKAILARYDEEMAAAAAQRTVSQAYPHFSKSEIEAERARWEAQHPPRATVVAAVGAEEEAAMEERTTTPAAPAVHEDEEEQKQEGGMVDEKDQNDADAADEEEEQDKNDPIDEAHEEEEEEEEEEGEVEEQVLDAETKEEVKPLADVVNEE